MAKGLGLSPRVDKYEQYEELLERKDIDAVEVCTPDHWHALQTIHACQAGKDVYVQKPLSFTIAEAEKMVRVANDTKRIVQVGSQQRSSAEFQKAIALVQSGAIGHIDKVYAKVGDPPAPLDLPEMKVPGNLNFNLWMGPLNDPKFITIPIFVLLFRSIRRKEKNYGVHGVGTAKPVTDLLPTGARTCSILHRLLLVWMVQVLL